MKPKLLQQRSHYYKTVIAEIIKQEQLPRSVLQQLVAHYIQIQAEHAKPFAHRLQKCLLYR